MKLISKLFILLLLSVCPTFALADNNFPSFPMAFWGTATLNGQPLTVGTQIQAFCNGSLVGQVTIAEDGIYGYVASTKNKLLVSNCSGDILFEYLPSGAINPLTGATDIKYTSGYQSGVTVNENLGFITGQSCSITNGTGSQTWNDSAWGDCIVASCDSNYHQDGNSCVSNSQSCNISNGVGSQTWSGSAWGSCNWVSCNNGYHQSGNACVADSTGGGGGGGGGTPTVTPIPTTTKKGDANGDGKVDKYDFALIMANWGKTGTSICDFNGDGKVDKYDFALLMSKWGL